LCAYDLFAGRTIRILGGRSEALPYATVERTVARKISSVLGRVEYARVIDGPNGVEPVPTTGASILSSTVAADGFVLVPPDREAYAVGETVKVWLYSS
jgi:molybdopterin molybdotransferase